MTKPTPNRYQVSDYKSPTDPRRIALLRDDLVDRNLTVVFEDEARDLIAQLTAWLDAPRLAARETAEVVARDDEHGRHGRWPVTAKSTPIVYVASLPDGSTATRRSPTRRVYTHAVARKIGDGPWEAVSFARTAELAESEARTQRNLQERWQRKHRNESHPVFTFAVVPCVAGGGQ